MTDRHDQNTEDSYPRIVEFEPAALQRDIESTVNPNV